MAFTLVQKSAAVANNSAGSVTATLPGGSTAGNTLVACVGSNVPGTQFSAPANWVQAAQISNGTLSRAEIWYLPSCPAGVTSAVFTCGTGQVRAALGEFHSSVAGATVTVDAIGTGTASATTTCTATGSGTAGDLLVSAFFEHLPSSLAVTWTDPAGWTLLASNTVANQNPMYSAYKLSAAGGAISVIGTSNQTAGTNGWSGCVVSFKEVTAGGLSVTTPSPMPGGTVGLPYNQSLAAVGGTPPYTWAITAGSLPAGTSLAASGGRGGLSGVTMASAEQPSPTVATANWEALTGINCTGRKCYFQVNPDGSGIFPTTNADNTIKDCINNNLVLYLCVKPALNPPTTHDYNGLQASVTAMQNLGLTVKVIIWQEVEDQVSNPTLYKAGLVFYAGAVHTPGALLCHDSAGSKHLLWSSFFPTGASAAVVDEYMIDFYANTYSAGARIDPWMAMAAATGKRAGVGEMGSSLGTSAVPPDTGPGSVTAYLQYVNGFAAALPPGLYAWYQQTNKNVNNIISDPSDFRIPLLQAIDATIAGTSMGGGAITGTPTTAAVSSFTARATDSNSVTATAALSITISSSAGSPLITTTSLPAATVGVAYTLTNLTETGGTAPFTWTVTTGALPDGLTLGPAGFIFGTPTTAAATSGFTVTVTDANNLADSQSLFITVVTSSPPPSPAPQRPGWPQLIIEAGLQPAAPQVPAGTFLLDDPTYGILDTDVLGDSTVWTDITLFARAVAITRPSTRVQGPLLTYQGGNSSVTLKNGDGRFDPDNGASPYAGSIRPMIPFRFRAVYGSAEYHLFSGFTGSWITPDTNLGPNYSEITVTADDGFKILAGITIPTGGGVFGDGDGEDSGSRVTRILTNAGWYTDHRNVAVGDSTVQGTNWGDTVLNLLQLTADSEIGELYMDGGGSVVFRNRDAIITDARSTQVQVILGDKPGFTVLSGQSAGFEGGAGTWTAAGNCATSATGAAAHTGTGALQLSSTAAGDMMAAHCTAGNILTQGLLVSPGQPVAASVWALTASAARTVQAGAQFYDSGGGALSTLYGTAVTDSTAAWVQATGSLITPATAAFCRLIIKVQATGGASEIHYLDDAQLYYPELPYLGVTRADDDTQLCNDVQATSVGLDLQEAQSASSQRTYLFPRTYARSDLILEDDPTTLAWAQWVLSVSLSGDSRFDAVTVSPLRDPGLWPHILGREIGDRVTVIRRPPGGVAAISRDCFIRGITHTIDASAGTWVTTWDLQSALRYTGFLILDDTVNGKLNTGKLAF